MAEFQSEVPNFDDEKRLCEKAIEQFTRKLEGLDSTLKKSGEAVLARTRKLLNSLDEKAERAVRRNHTELVDAAERYRHSIYPTGVFQERKMNVLDLVDQHGKGILDEIGAACDPLDFRLKIVKA
jgi:uncharacterized protein YllA (UPF0747 family)